MRSLFYIVPSLGHIVQYPLKYVIISRSVKTNAGDIILGLYFDLSSLKNKSLIVYTDKE